MAELAMSFSCRYLAVDAFSSVQHYQFSVEAIRHGGASSHPCIGFQSNAHFQSCSNHYLTAYCKGHRHKFGRFGLPPYAQVVG